MTRRPPVNGFKKGQKKPEGSDRKPGDSNRSTKDMKEALLAAATKVGFIRKVKVRPRGLFKRLLDAACNPDRPRWGFGGGDQCTAVSCRSKSASLVAWAQQDAKR